MKKAVSLMLLASGVGVVCLGAYHPDTWPVREEETLEKNLTLAAYPRRVVVENIDGYVHITPGGDGQVHVSAHKTIRADADVDLREAKNEVKLDMVEQPGSVSIQYNAPWVSRNNSGEGDHDHRRRFYAVTYDLDIQVPWQARPIVSTVNNGDIRVAGTTGDFEIRNVNGAIAMTNVAGSGQVNTINGPITVHFAKRPQTATGFSTINGDVDVYFPTDHPSDHLDVDLRFQTFHGEIFTDFDVTPIALRGTAGAHEGGKFVYRSRGWTAGRVGQGGPEISFHTLNGNIRVHRGNAAGNAN